MQFEDHWQVERLIYDYTRAIDQANWIALGDLFSRGEVRVGDEVSRGSDVVSLMQNVNRVHEDGTLRTRHLLTNVVIEIDDEGTSARADSYFMVFQQTDLLPLQPIAGGSYEDRFSKVDGKWGFVSKTIDLHLIGNVSEHLKVSLDDGPLVFNEITG